MPRPAYAGLDNDPDSPQARARDLRNGMERRLISLEGQSLKQLADCRGPLDLYSELYDGIREDFHALDAQLEEIALLAEEAGSEEERGRIQGLVDSLSSRLSRARVSFREASLQSKRRMDQAAASSQRDALFASSRKGVSAPASAIAQNSSGSSKDDELMAATANVTDGLRKTRQLLEQELERSSLSTQVLERSSQTLTLTSDQYTSFAGLLQASKNIITTMQKADTLDRLLILAALLFFGLVCLLIIKRRILDRGIRAATMFSRLAGGGSAAEASKNAKSSLASGLSSIAATATSISASATMSSTMSSRTTVMPSVVKQVPVLSSDAGASISSLGLDIEDTKTTLRSTLRSSLSTSDQNSEHSAPVYTTPAVAHTAATTLASSSGTIVETMEEVDELQEHGRTPGGAIEEELEPQELFTEASDGSALDAENQEGGSQSVHHMHLADEL